ncbi:MAG: flavodoxin family protein [Deltaproteobacteria bacterium]|nr:flavodoxin family protein [Deltaproteobacteria bacterium]
MGDFTPVLALQGSPRRKGNTDLLLAETLSAVEARGIEAEKVDLRGLNISPCLEIYQCLKNGECPIKDDMTDLYGKLTSARVIILASPIFFYGPSAQMKAVIDRCQALWRRRYVLKQGRPGDSLRKGYVISVAATKGRKLFDGLLLTFSSFFDVLHMKIDGQILIRGADQAGEVLQNQDAITRARSMGNDIAQFIESG